MYQEVLASRLVWRLSGLTLATSIRATWGRFATVSDYIAENQRSMEPWTGLISQDSVLLDFGCGPGGRLVALRSSIRRGYGIDINPFYVRHARRLAKRFGATNLTFVDYKGGRIPLPDEPLDIALGFGTFERIPREEAVGYINQISRGLRPDGRLIIYLLSERARHTALTRLLGESAYCYWSPKEIQQVVDDRGLEIKDQVPSGQVISTPDRKPTWAGDVYVLGFKTGR